jgi:hypothetical protein
MVKTSQLTVFLLTRSPSRHEHIYEKIEHHLLRSDEFPEDPGAFERTIGGSPVILCTLSMLSNPILDDRGLYELVPLERLVVDEASQIEVGEYMVGRAIAVVVSYLIVCSSISSTSIASYRKCVSLVIRNNVCIVLPLQVEFSSLIAVPPYGKDTVKSLQSVFEIKHLRIRAHFLNTQCETQQCL